MTVSVVSGFEHCLYSHAQASSRANGRRVLVVELKKYADVSHASKEVWEEAVQFLPWTPYQTVSCLTR
jgi:hypothetical protein